MPTPLLELPVDAVPLELLVVALPPVPSGQPLLEELPDTVPLDELVVVTVPLELLDEVVVTTVVLLEPQATMASDATATAPRNTLR